MAKDTCPFKVGDTVIYEPSNRGRGLVLHTEYSALEPGHKYKVVGVDKDAYVVLEGFEHVRAGGLHWTEFRKTN